MTNAGDDRKRKVCHILGKGKSVESRQVARGSSATDDYNTVEQVGTLVDAVEGSNDALLNLFALHDSLKQLNDKVEAIGIVAQLTAEVAIACRRGTGYNGNALGEERYGQFAVKVEHSFFFQRSHYLHALACHVAKRESRVDVGYDPRKAVVLMKLCMNLQKHLHAGMYAFARYALEMRTGKHPRAAPALSRGTGNGSAAELVFLHQLHIAVTGRLAHVCQLSLNPIVAWHA